MWFAKVAQLVEQLIRNQQVVGSSPIFSSKDNSANLFIGLRSYLFFEIFSQCRTLPTESGAAFLFQ